MSEEAKQFLKHKSILVLVFLNETLEYRTQENKKKYKGIYKLHSYKQASAVDWGSDSQILKCGLKPAVWLELVVEFISRIIGY